MRRPCAIAKTSSSEKCDRARNSSYVTAAPPSRLFSKAEYITRPRQTRTDADNGHLVLIRPAVPVHRQHRRRAGGAPVSVFDHVGVVTFVIDVTLLADGLQHAKVRLMPHEVQPTPGRGEGLLDPAEASHGLLDRKHLHGATLLVEVPEEGHDHLLYPAGLDSSVVSSI